MERSNSLVNISLAVAVLAVAFTAYLLYERRKRRRSTPVAASVDLIGRRIDLEHPDGSVVFSIERASRSWANAKSFRWAHIPTESERWFVRLVQQAGSILKPGILAGLSRTEIYKVTLPFPGELMRAQSGGFRAMVVNDHGQIAAHATLSKVTTAARVAAIWEAAAFVTAQKYLADIFQTLKLVNGGIREIQRWLSNERVASLQANSKTLQEIEAGLSTNRKFLAANPYYQSALADVERDCSKIAGASLLDIEDHIQDLGAIDLSGWWNANPEPLY